MLETSRSVMVRNSGSKMPQIEHPLLKMAKDNSTDIGLSPFVPTTEEGRPVAFEDEFRYKSKKNNNSRAPSRSSRSDTSMDNINLQGTFLTNIPESVSVIGGDTKEPRLPLFGNRSAIQLRSSVQSRHSTVRESEKFNIPEISDKFHKKLSSNYYEIRKKFIDNDPDRNGNVNKEALMRIVQQTTGFEITNNCLNRLLELWGVNSEKQIFSFNEINTIFVNKQKETTETEFIDPVSRHKTQAIVPSKMVSNDAYEFLKEKFRSREMYLSDLFPNSVESQKFIILKVDLKNALYKVMIDLIPMEMDKLWLKFDPTKQGSIDGMKFLKQMGIISYPIASFTPRIKATNEKTTSSITSLENLLKTKLRQGFTSLGHDFQKKDINQTGFISNADFLQVLANHNLNLEENQLSEFLSRCVITASKDGIPYKDFLVRFQDRSEAGVTHKLLTSRDNKTTNNIDDQLNPVSLVEMKLINIFQKDFLELLENFRKLDKYSNGSIEIKDFKRVLENHMNVKFTDTQFQNIVDNLPLNRNLTVPYLDFLKQFDTGTFSPLSFTSEVENSTENYKSEVLDTNFDEIHSKRSIAEIKNRIKHVFDSRFSDIEKIFNELDESNGKVLTQELMYQLMKRLDVKPELTRGDIRAVWKTFILNERQLLDFKEFTRHFMYNKLTASFPNAKICPPVKGDSDLMQRSRKLNAASDILLDNLRSKIDIMYSDLYMEFIHLDKENTGEVSIDDFQEILKELCIQLTDYEIEIICEKFKTSNKTISYIELLKPFGTNKSVHNKDHNPIEIPQNTKLKASFSVLNQKLRILTQSTMKRNLKKIDSSNIGYITISEFRALLLLEGVSLSEDEVFELMSRYDKNLIGSINYKLLIQELKSNV